ncbi:MAG: flagella basal body P-ring formation protein FlgA [Terracidiphilus sp.]|jgi:flagellar basal body P-ring formation chaperone FlgA
MKRLKVILSCMVVGVAACSAAAAQARYVISTDQIAATMSRMGMQVSPQQVMLLSDVVATKMSPILKVRSIERWDDQRMMARMECQNQGECLPFFVGLRTNQGNATPASGSSSQAYSSGPGLPSKAFVVRSGSPATLMLDSERVHIRLSVICLQNGAPGQMIRVTGKDRKLVFTAQVIDGGLLKGRL